MRIAFAALVLAGCIQQPSDPGWTPPPDPPPPYDPYCHTDSQCPGQVCARDGSCQDAANVHSVHLNWTLMGQPASAATCATAADLEVNFGSDPYSGFGFAPVPCAEGKFSVDKLPLFYTQTSVWREGDAGGGATAPIPPDGEIMVDLAY